MTNSDLEEKLEIALDPFEDRIKRAAATGQVLREFLHRIQKLEDCTKESGLYRAGE